MLAVMGIRSVVAQALELTPEDRADVAKQIIASLDDPADEGSDAAWLVEVERRLAVEARRVVITPVEDAPPTLAQRLARFDPARHGGEAMASDAVGAERW